MQRSGKGTNTFFVNASAMLGESFLTACFCWAIDAAIWSSVAPETLHVRRTVVGVIFRVVLLNGFWYQSESNELLSDIDNY